MDFLKKHYEKVLLGAVLLGLAVAAAFLPFMIGSEKQKLEALSTGLINPSVKPLSNLDLTLPEDLLKRAASPAVINFGPPNRLFNPMPWEKTTDNRLIPFDDQHVGPKAVTVTKITPLNLIMTLDNVTMMDSGPRYVIGIKREAAPNPNQRDKKQTYCSLNTNAIVGKSDPIILREVQGPPDNPTNLVIELSDSGERVNLSKEEPYRRVDGYMADLKYAPESKIWTNRRIGSQPLLSLNGEEYSVVAISTNEVVLSAKSNQKKWTIAYTPNPSAKPEPR